uniref:Uncharacterized protein n=1 Tax=Oryza nivara TaxID=4536 RepID=A0A0E0IFW5_ORYNI
MQHQLQCSGEGAASASASQSASQSGDDSRHRRHGNCPDAGGLDGDEQDGHRWRRARAGVLDARELAARRRRHGARNGEVGRMMKG